MQEIVLLLTGVAGAASAVAYRRLPRRGGGRRGSGGAGPGGGSDAAGRIRSRIGALAAERDILGKAISRVHEDAGLSGSQRDALLAMYQRQLAAVLAKIDRLEEASRYPDLGPVGDGLAELMDQKLSSLDERLHELSARIAAAVPAAAGAAPAASSGDDAGEAAQKSRARRPGKRAAAAAAGGGAAGAAAAGGVEAAAAATADAPTAGAGAAAQQATLDAPRQVPEAPRQVQQQMPDAKGPHGGPASPGAHRNVKPVEITTLTTIGGGERKFPEVGRPSGGARPARAQPPAAPPPSPPSPPSPPPQQQPAGPSRAAEPAARAQAAGTTAATAAGATAAGAGLQHAASPSLPDRLPKPRPLDITDAEEQVDGMAGGGDGDPDDDDVAAIVADIRSTLSKLEQAEVE